MVHSPRLLVTRRCIETDLGLDASLVGTDARDLCGHHDVLSKFVSQRSIAPDGGEIASGFPSGYRSLHDGRTRALTYWASDDDVCWLVCFNAYHAVGDRKDAYAVFHSLLDRDELGPTEDDYLSLADELTEDFIELVDEVGGAMLDAARSTPSSEIGETIQDSDGRVAVVIDLVVMEDEDTELEQGWVGITLPGQVQWPVMEVHALALVLTHGEDLVPCTEVGKRPARRGEMAFQWDAERPLNRD